MKITIDYAEKEMADFVLQIHGQPKSNLDVNDYAKKVKDWIAEAIDDMSEEFTQKD